MDQLLYDMTDLAIIVVVISVWALVLVGIYTSIRWVVLWIVDEIQVNRIERRWRKEHSALMRRWDRSRRRHQGS